MWQGDHQQRHTKRGKLTLSSSSLVVTLKAWMVMSSPPLGGAPAPHQPSSVFRTWVLLLWTRKKINPPITRATSTSVNMVLSVGAWAGMGGCTWTTQRHVTDGPRKRFNSNDKYLLADILHGHGTFYMIFQICCLSKPIFYESSND